MPKERLPSASQQPEMTISAFCDRMLRSSRAGKANPALHGIARFVLAVISRQDSIARVFSSRELDLACLEIGRELRETDLPALSGEHSDRIVFVVTHLAPTGGHSRVLDDLMEAEGASECTVLVSGVFNKLDMEEVAALYRSREVSLEMAPGEDLALRVRWLQRRLAELRPRKTYMLIHHFDAVSVAAVQPDLTGELVYFHNCDHSLALGVHIPHALHVDFNAKGFYNCREREGVRGNVVWPLTVPDRGHRVDRPFLARGHLTTCCSGGPEKFEFSHFREQISYAYRYEELVPYILKATGGTHIHIGRLSPRMLSAIAEGLARLGIGSERFIHVEFVPSLWQAFLDLDVDVYIGSFPLGGGRATIEAMGAGLPIIIHSNYRSCFLSVEFEVYEGASIWRKEVDLIEILLHFTLDRLHDHAQRARSFYDSNHRPSRLMAHRGAEYPPPVPRRPDYVPWSLQAYLDEHSDLVPDLMRQGAI